MLMAAALALPAVLPALAQNPPEQRTLSLRYLDYFDSQPGVDRVRVKAPVLGIVAPFEALGGPWSFAGSLIHDDISGASPAYHTRSIKRLTDRRNAVEASLTRHLERQSVTVGASFSTESDYVGRGLALQVTTSSDDNNRSWAFGAALARDSINPGNRVVSGERKRRSDWHAGVTQVLTPQDIVQFNLGASFGRGYFSDPYKVFDERPRRRDQRTFSARWNHHFESPGATLRTNYRWYADSFGIHAHTLAAEWLQPLPAGFTITPSLRLYSQGASRFYIDADPSSPFPPNPPAGALHYSEDQRLAAFGGRTLGLKIERRFGDAVTADLKLEHYVQRGAWRLGGAGSPGLAEFRARSVSLGLAWTF
jgi:hypothetical protein